MTEVQTESVPAVRQQDGRAPRRMDALDGLRALAVLSVFVYHGARDSVPILVPAFRYVEHADVGVEIFFVLSGYLIYRPFAVAHLRGGDSPRPGSYARRRFLRIFPLYWVVLATLAAAGRIIFDGLAGVLARVLLVHTYLAGQGGRGFDQSWTLVVELSFYVFVPLWAAVMSRAGRRLGSWRVESWGALILIAEGVGAQALFRSASWSPALRVLPTSMGALGTGMLLAVIEAAGDRAPRTNALLRSAFRREGFALSAVVIVYLGLTRLDPGEFFLRYDLNLTRMVQGYGQMLIAALLVAVVVFGDSSRGAVRRALETGPVVWIGAVSYGMYLWHFDLIHAVPDGVLQDHGVLPAVGGLACALAATVAAAGASYRLVERPAMRLGRGA